jgi:menaquinone-specific isochorismate synthase
MWGFTTVEVCVLSVSTALARLRDGLVSLFLTRPARELSILPFR